jgi:hypothetical protein
MGKIEKDMIVFLETFYSFNLTVPWWYKPKVKLKRIWMRLRLRYYKYKFWIYNKLGEILRKMKNE